MLWSHSQVSKLTEVVTKVVKKISLYCNLYTLKAVTEVLDKNVSACMKPSLYNGNVIL